MNSSGLPDISVIVTFFNARDTLGIAVDSILSQSFTDFEVLLVDDGSSDGSMDSLSEFDDFRLIRLQAGRIGRAAALNLGLRSARGEYVAILDADDLALPQRLSEQKSVLDTLPNVGLVCSSIELMDEVGNDLGFVEFPTEHEELQKKLLELNPFAHSSVMYRRHIALEVGGYNERCEKSIDFNFYLDMLSAGVRLIGQKKAHIRLRHYRTSWGKDDAQALQMRYGILGLINYYLRSIGEIGILRSDEECWVMELEMYQKWFERQGYRRRYEAKKDLYGAKVMLSKKRFVEGGCLILSALRTDFCCFCYSGVGFDYPHDVMKFVHWRRKYYTLEND